MYNYVKGCHNLKKQGLKGGIWENSDVGKGWGKLCNYILISRNERNIIFNVTVKTNLKWEQ